MGIKHHGSFSDPRKNHTAVGVKFPRLELTKKQINKIERKMAKKGFELAKVTPRKKYNQPMYNYFSGVRLTFYKKEYSFIVGCK